MTAVFVLVDALGWQVLQHRSFLDGLLPYRQELTTVFGFSTAAIPSILTGLLPCGHGHWNLFLYDPAHSPFGWARPLSRLPNRWINHRVARKAVAVISRKLSRTEGYFQIYGVPVQLLPLFDVCEKDDIYKPRGLRPSQSIFDLLEERKVPYRVYSYHQYTDRQAVDQVVRDLGAGAASFYFVYLSELDEFLHRHLHEPDQVNAELDRYERAIGGICEAALASEPEASVYVFSDHGMTPIRETFDLMGAIRRLGLAVPRDYVALYDSTMARFWFFQEEARRQVTAALEGLACGSVLSPEQQAALGIDFPHRRFGDLIFLMKAGCLIHPSYMGRAPFRGMHGFHPGDRSSSAALLARRPPPVPVATIADMFDLMRQEAGIA